MKEKRIVGISPWAHPDYTLMKKAGIEWLRMGFGFPFADKIGGALTPGYQAALASAKKRRAQGFKIMGITPLAGVCGYDKKTGKAGIWRSSVPAWAGTYTSRSYYNTYQEACRFMARQTKGIVDMWQVGNEMDTWEFSGPMRTDQVLRFLRAGGTGVKQGNPECRAGNNCDIFEKAPVLKLYSSSEGIFDYAGIDRYFGSWTPGKPQDLAEILDAAHALTGKPVLIAEWGYPSLGGRPRPPKKKVKPGLNSVCATRAWHNVWKKEQCVREQGEYLTIGLKILATYPNCLGGFFYNWGDSETCFRCGSSTCPAECGWGLVDNQGRPKKSYYTFKETVLKYYR